jgi:hypothetical protein
LFPHFSKGDTAFSSLYERRVGRNFQKAKVIHDKTIERQLEKGGKRQEYSAAAFVTIFLSFRAVS